MPRRADREIFEELLAAHEPKIRAAFIDAVRDLVDNITLRVVVERLERGDVAGAIDAMHLDAEAFGMLERAIADAYNSGGQATVGNLPRLIDPTGARVVFRFSIRNPEAEAWLRQHSSTLVTRIVDDQREAIRTAFTEGLAQGQNPRVSALDVVGRVSRVSNRREGGVIGLTAQQERFVASARQELSSGDPEAMAHYLTRGRRDKRFDRTIAKAIREGKPVPADMVARITGRYADSLLALRGELIGQNETATALNESRKEGIRQQIASGKIAEQDVRKTWKHTPGEHPRLHHLAMNGKSVAWGEKFVLPNGVEMDHPHSSDAPISETAFCKCLWLPKISYFAAVERRFRAEAA
jgi:hypothetical protein